MLSQENLPGLWFIFQNLIGAVKEKREIALSHVGDANTILEVGCSIGLVSSAFKFHQGISFTGIDIDSKAISIAMKKFKKFPHLRFSVQSLKDLSSGGSTFDYVMFGNVLHHVDDETFIEMMNDVLKITTDRSLILIVEPDVLRNDDGFLKRMYYRLEKGKYRRSGSHLISLARSAGLQIISFKETDCGALMLPGVDLSRMLVLATKRPSDLTF